MGIDGGERHAATGAGPASRDKKRRDFLFFAAREEDSILDLRRPASGMLNADVR